MNRIQIEGGWKQIQDLVKGKWVKLTKDDSEPIAAKKDRLLGKKQVDTEFKKEASGKQFGNSIPEQESAMDSLAMNWHLFESKLDQIEGQYRR